MLETGQVSTHLTMLLHLLTNENVCVIDSKDLRALLSKLYCFTPKFNVPRFENIPELVASSSKDVWPDTGIVFTRILEAYDSH